MFAFALGLFADATPLPATSNGLTAYFPGNATSASMGTGGSMVVTAQYDNPGVQADSFSFQVQFNGASGPQWHQEDFSPTQANSNSQTFDSSKAGWQGPGTYTFFIVARHTATGLYDVTSNTITLTVA